MSDNGEQVHPENMEILFTLNLHRLANGSCSMEAPASKEACLNLLTEIVRQLERDLLAERIVQLSSQAKIQPARVQDLRNLPPRGTGDLWMGDR